MKHILLILLLGAMTAGCSSNTKENNTTDPQTVEQTEEEIKEGKFPRASHIFWIDLDKNKKNKEKVIRNVKVKALVDKEGKVKVLEYEKKQPSLRINKIEKCLRTFRVKPEWLENGKIKTGEQIVFLRFIDEY
ncbi:DUF4891 domain-containing protein [Phocaeicola sp.]